ncbi:hypothetical protein GCM10018771_20590 [Streptomyces cellulosae]|nr:hypothetical protein GCM10018771_20590 [Streptomyces cellulosae]
MGFEGAEFGELGAYVVQAVGQDTSDMAAGAVTAVVHGQDLPYLLASQVVPAVILAVLALSGAVCGLLPGDPAGPPVFGAIDPGTFAGPVLPGFQDRLRDRVPSSTAVTAPEGETGGRSPPLHHGRLRLTAHDMAISEGAGPRGSW